MPPTRQRLAEVPGAIRGCDERAHRNLGTGQGLLAEVLDQDVEIRELAGADRRRVDLVGRWWSGQLRRIADIEDACVRGGRAGRAEEHDAEQRDEWRERCPLTV